MKKYIIGTILLSACFSFVSAQVAGDTPLPEVNSTCVDLQNNLTYKKSKDSNTNGEVSDLQSFLQEQGLLTSDPTGYFGALTFNAVKSFQKQNNLFAYGYVGAVTREMIKNVSCSGVSIVEIPSTDPSGGVQVKFLPGCYSLSGYSISTGQACNGGERKACTQEWRGCSDGSTMPRDASCGWHPEQCSVNATTTVDSPRVGFVEEPTLKLEYDSSNKEVALTAVYKVSITASKSSEFKLYKSGMFDNDTYAFLISLNNAQRANRWETNGSHILFSGNAIDNGGYWSIPAGQTAVFNLTGNLSNPKDLYAGSYSATLSLYKPSRATEFNRPTIFGNAVTNSVTVVGENTSPLNSSVSVTTISGPSLRLIYDSNNKESSLLAKATVQVKAGNTDLTVLKPTATETPSGSLFFDFLTLDNNSGYGGVATGYLTVSSTAYDKGDFWIIPAGTSAVFNLNRSFDPKKMFAGSYHAVPFAYITLGGGPNLISSKDGNYVTIIGETSPYISSVEIGEANYEIKGSRFSLSSNYLTINGTTKNIPGVTSKLITFYPADFNLVSGATYIVQVNNKGASNNFSFTFNGKGTLNSNIILSPNGGETININNQPIKISFKPVYGQKYYFNLVDVNGATLGLYGADNGYYTIGMAMDKQTVDFFASTVWVNSHGSQYKLQACTVDVCDSSDNYFTVTSSNSSSAVSITKNSGFTAQTVSPNTANVKIGSFMIKNNSNGQENLSNIGVNLSLSGYSVTNLSNLRLMVDSQMTLSTPIGNPTQGINNFPVSWSIGANASPTVDIYADIGGAQTGSVVANMSADGITSTEGVAITSSVSGLANPTLSQNSPASQFVIGGSTFGLATFRLATAQAGTNATVRELRFVAGGQDAIESITVNGVTGWFADGQGITIISGLNIPVSSTGVDIPVTVKFSGFQYSTSGGYLNSGVSNVGLKLNYIEATSGSGQVITNTTPVSSNGMTLVASKPTVTLGSVVGAGPLILGAENKIGEFVVTADANGKISLSSIGLNLSSSGITNVSYEAFRVLSGNTPIVINENGSAGSAKIINFYSPYEIGAGQSVTFSVYARVNGMAQAGVSPTVYSSLLPSAFTWKDVIGGNMQYTGDNLVSFPMNSYTVRGDGGVVAPPTVSISAYPTTINQGQSSTISWESLGTTSCMANSVNGNDLDWMGNTYANGKPSGSVTVSPTVTSIYEISCNNSTGGNMKKTATVTVNNSVDITPSITSISQSQIEEGSNTTVTIYGTNLKFINNNLQVEFFKDGIDLGASGVNYSDVNGDGTQLLFTFIPNVWQAFKLKAGNTYQLRVSNDAQKNKSGFLNIVVLPAPAITCSDPIAYYYYYAPDVKAAGADALNHWNTYGYKEGRKSCWQAPAITGVSNNRPTGVIDSVSSGPVGSCGNVAGWAYDADNSLASTEINLYVDGPAGSGVGINAGPTKDARTDVNQYFGLPGGNHGYSYQIPNLTPGNHTVYSYSQGLDTAGKQVTTEPVLLVNSPMSFNCTNPVSFLNPSSQKPVVLGDYISNASCTNLPYNMHRGYEDNNVKNLQSFLVSRGLLTDTPTSFYGDKTVEAVKAYQSSKGLPVTGMVFDFTRSAIKAESCK